jgi:hypothetical protein
LTLFNCDGVADYETKAERFGNHTFR